jgi:hypothetical protein
MLTRPWQIHPRPPSLFRFGYLHDFSSVCAVPVVAAGHQSAISVELGPYLACPGFKEDILDDSWSSFLLKFVPGFSGTKAIDPKFSVTSKPYHCPDLHKGAAALKRQPAQGTVIA